MIAQSTNTAATASHRVIGFLREPTSSNVAKDAEADDAPASAGKDSARRIVSVRPAVRTGAGAGELTFASVTPASDPSWQLSSVPAARSCNDQASWRSLASRELTLGDPSEPYYRRDTPCTGWDRSGRILRNISAEARPFLQPIPLLYSHQRPIGCPAAVLLPATQLRSPVRHSKARAPR